MGGNFMTASCENLHKSAVSKNGNYKWRHMLRRFKKDEGGVAAVEFAMVAFPFFFLLTTIIEASLFFFAGQMLESAVDRVGRDIRTGQLGPDTTVTQMKAAVCREASVLFRCSGLLVDVASAASFDDLGDPPAPEDGELDEDSFGYTAPAASQIMRITVTYQWPVVTNYVAAHLSNMNGNKALLSAMSVFQTEPY